MARIRLVATAVVGIVVGLPACANSKSAELEGEIAPTTISDVSVPDRTVLTSGSLPVGGSYLVEIPTHCGVAVLGRKINDIFWTVTGSTQRGEDWMPVEWFESLSPGEEQLTVEMSLSDDEARLTLTAAGRTVTYRPMTADDPEFLCA